MYSDKAYFLTKIKQTELDKLTGAVDANLISAIEAADDTIDSYLRTKVNTLPLASPSETIRQCSYAIAIYGLHDRPQFNSIPDWVRMKYEDAMNYLKDVASGRVTLTVNLPAEQKESSLEVGGKDLRM